MSGGGSAKPPKSPSPAPSPVMGAETDEAKKKIRRRIGFGREATILAAKMMQANDFYKSKTILG